jgi:hypothetical protein
MYSSEPKQKGRPSNERLDVVVVYKKPKGKKHFLEVFNGVEIDSILNNRVRKPHIPNEFELVDMGVGFSFVEKYTKQYKIK